jgi:ribosome-associated heat shock protein Hsp15
MTGGAETPREIQRLDKWLVYARFCKTRSAAAKLVANGMRINGRKIEKPDSKLHVGDVLTLINQTEIRLLRVLQLVERRGSPQAAQQMYEFLPQAVQSLE